MFINMRQFLAVLWTFELLLHFDHLFSYNLQNWDKLCTNHKQNYLSEKVFCSNFKFKHIKSLLATGMQGITLASQLYFLGSMISAKKYPNASQQQYIFPQNKTVKMSICYQIPNVAPSKFLVLLHFRTPLGLGLGLR